MKMGINIFNSNTLVIVSILVSVYSCNFAQSINKDLATGLVSRGNGIACDQVYLSVGDEEIKRNSFKYGEDLNIVFDGIEGFQRVGESVFPGMQLVVMDHHRDTVLYHQDLYADYPEGIEFSPLRLTSNVTLADPIHSSGEYTLFLNIWDKKGDGTFKVNLDFTVVSNEKIKISSSQISYDEIYLFSQQKGVSITDNHVGFDETIYMLFEGLEGFMVESGNVFIGLSIRIQDADGNMILNEEDLMGDAGVSYADIHTQLAPNFILTGSQISNPVHCEISIWDKKGTASIETSVHLNVE